MEVSETDIDRDEGPGALHHFFITKLQGSLETAEHPSPDSLSITALKVVPHAM